MTPKLSILISTFNRLKLFRRTLWHLVNNPPPVSYEVVVADDGSSEPILDELRLYSARFPWKFITVSANSDSRFASDTGVSKFFNNPSLTYNVAFRHCRGDWIIQQGVEVIPWGNCYAELLESVQDVVSPYFLAFTTVYDVPEHILIHLDAYGTNLSPHQVEACRQWPLASPYFHTDVTNYVSLCSRALYEKIGGYDERYLRGVGKEDSDFVRRCRKIPGWTDSENMRRTNAIALHQSHRGRTWWGNQDQTIISDARWKEGEKRSKEVWDRWDGTCENKQEWEWGKHGVISVVSSYQPHGGADAGQARG